MTTYEVLLILAGFAGGCLWCLLLSYLLKKDTPLPPGPYAHFDEDPNEWLDRHNYTVIRDTTDDPL